MHGWKKPISKAIVIVFLLVLGPAAGTPAQEEATNRPLILSGHPGRPPFLYRSGETIVGFGPDLAGIILSRLNVPYQSRFMGPWKRVQEWARQGKVDMIAGLYRTPERESYLVFSEPIFNDPTSVFMASGKPLPIKAPQDLIPLFGVTLFGDSFGEKLDRLIGTRLRMVRVYTPPEMFDLLLSGKVDYLLFGYYAGLITANRLGVGDKVVAVKKDLVVVKAYLAFSKQSPYIHLLPAINREIHRLQAEGRIDELVNEHLSRYLAGDGH